MGDYMHTINILWTTDNPDTSMLMIQEYAQKAKSFDWWEHVRVILWGGSVRLIKNNKYIQVGVMQMVNLGIEVVASKNCAESVDAVLLLEKLEVDVKYMGKELTDIIKDEQQALITI